MRQDYQDLLRPEIINSIDGLSLIAQIIAGGSRSGLNKSRRVGQGMEFSQYRGYEPGDDLRLLDWKMLARSGRYYVKQAEVDTNISIKFIVDASKSMEHTENGISKMDFVRIIVASLAYLIESQGDIMELHALNEKQLYSLHGKSQKQQLNLLLYKLLEIKSEGKWPSHTTDFQKFHDRSRKELLFFLTDLYQYDSEIVDFIKRMKTSRNEVVLLHIAGQHEIDFDYKGTLNFEDLELGLRVKVKASDTKKIYLEKLQAYLENIKGELLNAGIGYELFRMNEPLYESLRSLLKKRSRLS
ncbi:MAG: DUF58 domain-containing protein [Leeuwenhoekiella sp.]